MKTIRLTPQQRKALSDRRRHAPDRRIYQRLSAVLWSDDGRTREEIAGLEGVSTRQVGQWFRIFRNKRLDEPCTFFVDSRVIRIEGLSETFTRNRFETDPDVTVMLLR